MPTESDNYKTEEIVIKEGFRVNSIDDIEIKSKGNLTIKQIEFVKEYVRNGGKARMAYMKVYNSTNKQSASVSASKLLKKPHVNEFLQRMLEIHAAENHQLTGNQILGYLNELASDSEVDNKIRLRALELLAKKFNLFESKAETEKDINLTIDLGEFSE